MKPALGSVDLVGKSGTDINVRCQTNGGLGLFSVSQDTKADPFGWQSMVALLGLWVFTGMERCETFGIKHIQTCSISRR